MPYIDRDATLARFTCEELAAFNTHRENFASPEHYYSVESVEKREHKAMCFALGLPGYTQTIWEIDPTLNPVGVEEWMRRLYTTLDALPHAKFVAEAELLRELETQRPGFLRKCAGDSKQFRQAEKLVQVTP